MATFELLDTRRISGRGVLKIPPAALKYRYYVMFVDLLRSPSNPYLSRDWNPNKSLYARMAFRRDGYVVSDAIVEYERQQFTYVSDISAQTLIAVKCAYEGILQSFVNLVGGLSGTPGGVGIFVTSVDNLIADFQGLALGWDEVLFNCYSGCALTIRFYGTNYDRCNPLEDDQDNPPPPPPLPPPLPPGTAIDDISEPYDPGTGDDGNTIPFPGDGIQELPFGEECVIYAVTYTVRVAQDNSAITGTTRVFGQVEAVTLENAPGASFVQITCRGDADIPGAICLESPTDIGVFGATEEGFYDELISFSIAPG